MTQKNVRIAAVVMPVMMATPAVRTSAGEGPRYCVLLWHSFVRLDLMVRSRGTAVGR